MFLNLLEILKIYSSSYMFFKVWFIENNLMSIMLFKWLTETYVVIMWLNTETNHNNHSEAKITIALLEIIYIYLHICILYVTLLSFPPVKNVILFISL